MLLGGASGYPKPGKYNSFRMRSLERGLSATIFNCFLMRSADINVLSGVS